MIKSRVLLIFLCAIVDVLADDAKADDATVNYLLHVKPILQERCYSCHAALKQEGGLRLDTVASVVHGGDSGAALVAGDASASLLIHRIAATDEAERMPPEGKPLTAEQIRVITEWIHLGAVAPPDDRPEEDPRQHWAFVNPVRPDMPSGGHQFPNPIDALLDVQRHAQGITAMGPTDRATLLRRVYLDLVGLPPSADDLQAFLRNESPAAYEETVDRLLASPQHGERWGRHWMDVWRYSDWYGRRSVPDVMNSYPMIWRWRDWIVRSLNADKPYDQMVTEMLAADEVLPADDQDVVATGYLVRSWFKWNYETWKKDLVEHTGKAFLGITLNCCQCHDHKYDPFTQEEYFRFRAFFEPLELRHDRVPGEADPGRFQKYVYANSYGPINTGMIRVFDEYLNAETFMFSKGDARLKIEGKPPVRPAGPAVLGGDTLAINQIIRPIEVAYPGMKEFVKAEERAKRQTELETAKAELEKARGLLSAEPPELRQELESATTALQVARAEAIRSLQKSGNAVSLVLQGEQSLTLDAKAGRRALSHSLPGLDDLAENATVSYLVRIVKDGHTNLQLGLDIAQGATGGFIAFENGTIRTYVPGGFNEFVAGRYDVSKGQDRFAVTMRLDLPQNQFLLTVKSLGDDAVLVEDVPSALNGWRPAANGKRGLFIDCRPGTEAIYDDLRFAQPDGSAVLTFDFEAPDYADGQDVVDLLDAASAPWMATAFSQAPSTSKITSATGSDPSVRAAVDRLSAARQAVRLPTLQIAAAEAQVKAAELELASLEQRVAADAARYATGLLSEAKQADPEVKARIHGACQAERTAALATARADVATAEAAVAAAEVKVSAAAKQTDAATLDAANKELLSAQQSRVAAVTAVSTAQANLAREPGEYSELSPKYPQVTSGRRSVLARWIAHEDNPLTARVAVNHIWLRHFGQAIVETTHDFGRNGSRPSHPELLDWLACELMDSGWSMKHVHRLIVTSQAYQMTSLMPRSAGVHSAAMLHADSVDPDNRTYWRFPAARMQAEVVRDSLLEVAGELDKTLGGQEIDHQQGMTSRRRSLYFSHHGEEKMEFLELFDAPNACDCYKRTSSVQPQQALALTNSELTRTLSRTLAKKLWDKIGAVETGGDGVQENEDATAKNADFVRRAFLQVLNREPRDVELAAAIRFVEEQSLRLSAANRDNSAPFDAVARSRENLVHALMNHNDFVTVR